MPGEPTLSKHIADPGKDHKPMSWERLLLLRAWAKWIAWREGCTVAMVGSVLEQTAPRDIDVALIWPAAKFEEMFGTDVYAHFEDGGTYEQKRRYQDKHHALYISGQELVNWDTRIDVRLCPDSWWPEKDRMILATPSETEPPNSWKGVEFIVRKVVRAGEGEEGA